MPVFLTHPLPVVATADTWTTWSGASQGVPSNAAAVLLNIVSWYQDSYFCYGDYFNPYIGVGGAAGGSTEVVGDKRRVMALVPMGPLGDNPDKNFYIRKYHVNYPLASVRIVGYFTYQELELDPRLTAGDRVADYLMTVGTGTPFATDTGEYVANYPWMPENLANLPAVSRSGMDWGHSYGAIYSADTVVTTPTGVPYELQYLSSNPNATAGDSFLVCGCDYGTGDLLVNLKGRSAPVDMYLVGLLKAKITWFLGQYPEKVKVFIGLRASNPMRLGDVPFNNAGAALVSVPNGTDWAPPRVYGEGETGTHITDVEVEDNLERTLVVQLHSSSRVVIDDSRFNTTESIAARTGRRALLLGYFHKLHPEMGETHTLTQPLEAKEPELYYPPNNTGSLHIDYPLQSMRGVYPHAAELEVYLSGGASNTDPALSLGGGISGTVVPAGLHTLFDLMTSKEAYVGVTEYRCVYLKNTSTVHTAKGVRMWMVEELENARWGMGSDPAGVNGTAQLTGGQEESPNGVSLIQSSSLGQSVTLTSLAPGEYLPVWLSRRATVEYTGQKQVQAHLYISVLNDGV